MATSFADLTKSLGEAIRRRRTARGWTLKQLAAKADIALGFLSQVEVAKASPSLETVYRICLALEITVVDLFYLADKCIQFSCLEADVLKTNKKR